MTHRIRGTIKLISRQPKVFGIILGDDFRDYFFIPSYMQVPEQFVGLTSACKLTVEFEPRARLNTDKRYAWDVSVLFTTTAEHTDAEARR